MNVSALIIKVFSEEECTLGSMGIHRRDAEFAEETRNNSLRKLGVTLRLGGEWAYTGSAR